MDDGRFDALTRVVSRKMPRRQAIAALAGLGLATLPWAARARKHDATRSADADAGQGRYRTLASKWWAWAIDQNLDPLFESGDVDCAAGQRGNTWFLAGSGFGGDQVERSCSVPAGTKLFFPVINYVAFSPPGQDACPAESHRTTRQLQEHQDCVTAFIDAGVDPAELTATVDGSAALITRARSALYPLHVAAGNVFGAPPGTYLEATDGYWTLLDPLPPGEHDISFTADYAGVPAVDVTYHLAVG
ncbi:MAG TPA: hypothetical protein VFU81_05355 [Thermomicrobiales bacterium]|nr:hypothetical protein [Thermomicrobiales bacterium]